MSLSRTRPPEIDKPRKRDLGEDQVPEGGGETRRRGGGVGGESSPIESKRRRGHGFKKTEERESPQSGKKEGRKKPGHGKNLNRREGGGGGEPSKFSPDCNRYVQRI